MNKIFKKLVIASFTMVMFSCALFAIINAKSSEARQANLRTIELSNSSIDTQSIFDEFNNADLRCEGSKVSFSGSKQLDSSKLSEIDLIAFTDMFGENATDVQYDLSIDRETGSVEFTLSMLLGGERVSDTMYGILIERENVTDALFVVDGETIYLSEICDTSVLDNVGLFSRIVNAVKNVIKSVKAVFTEPLKVVIVAISPVAKLLGGVVETLITPVAIFHDSANSYNNDKIVYDEDKKLITTDNYIIDQDDEYYGKWRFGFGNLQDNGCGVIATYNVLMFTGKIENELTDNLIKYYDTIDEYHKYRLANIIESYEASSCAIIHGKLGLNPEAITPMLTLHGVKIAQYVTMPQQFAFESACDNLNSNQMGILCYWWRNSSDGSIGAHYVTFIKSGNGYKVLNGNNFTSMSSYLHDNSNRGFIEGWIVTK